jgi:hypothetical protein
VTGYGKTSAETGAWERFHKTHLLDMVTIVIECTDLEAGSLAASESVSIRQ